MILQTLMKLLRKVNAMPSNEIVDKALSAIKQPAAYEYFFEQLNSPTWITPLRARGFFANPPSGEVEGEYTRFPFWPESRYLARVASQAPGLVMDTLQNIPDTDNPRVLADIIDAALEMPPNISVELANRATSWVGQSYLNLVADKIGKYAIHLANGGYPQAAFRLTRALLTPVSQNRRLTTDSKWSIAEVTPLYDLYTYRHIAESTIPAICKIDPESTLKLLAKLLEIATSLKVPSAQPPDDLSSLWRNTIEPTSQNSPIKTVTDILVDVLRDSIESCIESNSSTLQNILTILGEHSWNIFRRLEYHTLRTNLDAGWELAVNRIFDRKVINNLDAYHEFWLLVRSAYPRLDNEEQQKFITLLEEGPSTLHEDDPERHRKVWLARRLAIIKELLDESTRRKFDLLVADLGFEPEHPEYLSYISSMTGPTSPRTPNDLKQMSSSELIDFLNSWRPSEEFMGPSPEGLARSLTTLIGDQPDRYADLAIEFTNVAPIYIRGFIDGWTEAAQRSKVFNWEYVFDFCIKIIGKTSNKNNLDDSLTSDQWRWVRRSMTYLILRGLEQEPCQIPADLRSKLWAMLEPLTYDIDPTSDFEEQYISSSMGPAEVAINTTRGQAMHDAIRYGLWVAHTATKSEDHKKHAFSFEQLPELRRVLDEHLDTTIDPSSAVRSVYGQWLLWIYMLDASWVEQNINKIFPDHEQHRRLWDAAWSGYLFYCPVNNIIFKVLHDQYLRAVGQIEEPGQTESTRSPGPDARLGQHLILLYLRGEIQITDSVADLFFDRASTNLRQETLAHAGRVIDEFEQETPQAVERATALWESRSDGENRDSQELKAFGWWFVSTKLPKAWAIRELTETLTITAGKIENEYGVLRRLAEIADQDPRRAVTCIERMANADRENIILLGSADIVYSILETALASDQTDARQDALNLVHSLGARGYLGLRPLLSVRPTQEPSE